MEALLRFLGVMAFLAFVAGMIKPQWVARAGLTSRFHIALACLPAWFILVSTANVIEAQPPVPAAPAGPQRKITQAVKRQVAWWVSMGESTRNHPSPPLIRGEFTAADGQTYAYYYGKRGEKYGVVFEPFLARRDDVLVGMCKELIRQLYGNPVLKSNEGELLVGNGVNYIVLHGKKDDFLFMPYKDEESRQTFGLRAWKVEKG